MNRTWGQEQRVTDPENVRKKLTSGMNSKNPKTPLAHALKNKNTIRLGNKTDPFQNIEKTKRISSRIIGVMEDLDWSYVVQTKYVANVVPVFHKIKVGTLMPIVSPGLEMDWELFEKCKTTNPIDRLRLLNVFNREHDIQGGVNGEPFIPGYHSERDFEQTLKLLKTYNIKSYNTYHLHFNDLVAKNFHEAGLDIELIWKMNQDENWKPILQNLIDLAKKYDIILGCPDFVNSGLYQEKTNTCCGLNVPNPTKFTMIEWKKKMLWEGKTAQQAIDETWDGVGDRQEALDILTNKQKDMYTIKDIEIETKKGGLF